MRILSTPRCRWLQTLSLAAALLSAAHAATAQLNIVTTTTDLASIAEGIVGSRGKVSSIAKGYQDPHFVDGKPSYLVKLQRADLFVLVGMELEQGWAPSLLTNSRNGKIQKGASGYVDASVGISKLQIPSNADRSMGDIHPFGNPHYWLDPGNGSIIARNIAEGLERVDPGGAEVYARNLAAFIEKLDTAIERWAGEAASLRGLPVVAYHDSWPYLEQRFGFEVVAFVEPKPGIAPSGRYIAGLAETMKARGVDVILMTAFYNKKTASLVARETGAALVTLAQSVGGVEGADDYIALFDTNLDLLRRAASGE